MTLELDNEVDEFMTQTEGEIEFRDYTGYVGRKLTVYPKWDGTKAWYKGVAKISAQMRESGESYVDPEDAENPLAKLDIVHGLTMSLSNPVDRLVLEWALRTGVVYLDYESGKNDPEKVFYIYSREKDTQREEKRYEMKLNAQNAVWNLSQDDLFNVVRLLGTPMSDKQPSEVRNFLMRQIDDNKTGKDYAKKVLEVINDQDKDTKLWVLKAVDKGVITQNDTGSFYYGKEFLGYRMAEVVRFLQEPKQAALLTRLQEDLNDFTISAAKESRISRKQQKQ